MLGSAYSYSIRNHTKNFSEKLRNIKAQDKKSDKLWLISAFPLKSTNFSRKSTPGLRLGYELHRFAFKARPQNKGRLHTEQLASLSIHPNYFGDLFMFTGMALVIGNKVPFVCVSLHS